MNLLYFPSHQFSCHNSRKATNKTRYFDILSDLQFSPYVPIQLIPVGVERSNGTPTGTSRLDNVKLHKYSKKRRKKAQKKKKGEK